MLLGRLDGARGNRSRQLGRVEGTDYQVTLKVGESCGASGENLDVNSHCTDFPNDITFTDSGGTSQLHFRLSNLTGTTASRLATFVVNVTADLSSNQNIYYIYYCKSGQSSTSNGDDTFYEFDDAESGTATGRWVANNPSYGYIGYSTAQHVDGSKSLYLADTSAVYKRYVDNTTGASPQNGVYGFWVYHVASGRNHWVELIGDATGPTLLRDGSTSRIMYYNGTAYKDTGYTWTIATWEHYRNSLIID
jgi:hypothetical protein